jgi:hypothetical protein
MVSKIVVKKLLNKYERDTKMEYESCKLVKGEICVGEWVDKKGFKDCFT